MGIPQGRELLRFATAAQRQSSDLPTARQAVVDALGDEGLIEAAATVAVFNGLVRVADGTGIQLDDGLESVSAKDRSALGLDRYAGASNTQARSDESSLSPVETIAELFG